MACYRYIVIYLRALFSYSFEEVRRTFHPQILRVKDRCVCMNLMHDLLMIYT